MIPLEITVGKTEPSVWLDFAKTLAGAFVGAGLAFGSNAMWLWKKKRDEHLASGNLTLVTLGLMFDTFWNYKKAMTTSENQIRAMVPSIPDWLVMKPAPIDFNESLFLDVKSIAFLLDGEKQSSFEAFNNVMFANIQFRSLANLFADHKQFSIALQEKMTTISEANGVPPDFTHENFELIEKKLGLFTTAQVSTLNANIRLHFEKDEEVYRTAMQSLEKVLLEKYKRRHVRKVSVSSADFAAKPIMGLNV